MAKKKKATARAAKRATRKAAKASAAGTRHVLSAAVLLGGKMSATTIQMPITNIYMDGDYTGLIYLGSQKKPANVILDTGSSTLAIDGNSYDPTKDKTAKITDLAQEVSYADKSNWIGGVVLVDITAGMGSGTVTLKQCDAAVAYHVSASMFRNAQGILGLAYTKLNNAFEMPGPTIPPKYTFNQIQTGKMTYIEPYFTQLEEQGLVANKFAFYTKRSMVNMTTANPSTDPLNNGYLILGGGEEYNGTGGLPQLYTGSFQVARVVHDLYYNTNLKSIQVGSTSPIPVPTATKASGNVSNSVVDSGTNGVMLEQSLFDAMAAKFSSAAGTTLEDAMQAGYVPMSKLNLSQWPPITLVLEGALGTDVSLTMSPQTYWQTDSPKKGYAQAVIFGDDNQGVGQSILGLPLMNNYFTVFDRSVSKGLGVVSFAPIN
jgi:hypothetical protein